MFLVKGESTRGGVAFDTGIIYRFNQWFHGGVMIKNFISAGYEPLFDNHSVILWTGHPMLINLGISLKAFDKLVFAFDVKNILEAAAMNQSSLTVSDPEIIDYSLRKSFHIGAEYYILEWVALRAGMYAGAASAYFDTPETMKKAVTTGVGLKIAVIEINVAAVNDFRAGGAWQWYLSASGAY